jgi:hypothetical protein
MSDFLDKARDLASDLTAKAKDAVSDHSDQIDDGIDKAAEFVDEKTKGKYSDKIGTVQSKAHEVVGKLAGDGKGDTAGGEGTGGAPGEGGTGGGAAGDDPAT